MWVGFERWEALRHAGKGGAAPQGCWGQQECRGPWRCCVQDDKEISELSRPGATFCKELCVPGREDIIQL